MAASTKSAKGNNSTEVQSVGSNQDKLTTSEIISTKTEETSTKTDNDAKTAISTKQKGSKVDMIEDKTSTEKIPAEYLPEKKSHKIGDGCSLFPIYTFLYFL